MKPSALSRLNFGMAPLAINSKIKSGRGTRFFLLAILATATPLPGAERPATEIPASEDALLASMRGDAAIRDLCFVDAQTGWAVGDRGVTWHTSDGGRTWNARNSGVDCSLRSVHFLDARTGWTAGGIHHPYGATSRGVLLRTQDGGQTWSEDRGLVLPALGRVLFLTPSRGWAIGEPSTLFPTGMFWTEDGGRTWRSSPGEPSRGWLAADFMSADWGCVAARDGSMATVQRRESRPANAPSFGWRSVRDLRFVSRSDGWLVGDGGLVMTTHDAGQTWRVPPTGERAIPQDFNAMAVDGRGAECWIVGSPGSIVLHTSDFGQTWERQRTPVSIPLAAVSFVDSERGWAAGALGTILATEDGGQSWRVQRAGGARMAALAVYSEVSAAPWELFARLAANEGYFAQIDVISRRELEPEAEELADLEERFRSAAIDVGACGAEIYWGFPRRQAGFEQSAEGVVEDWNRAAGDDSLERLERLLTLRIRALRPEIVVTQAANGTSIDPMARVANQAVLRGVEFAADETRFPDQISELGLSPWRVKKVLGGPTPGPLGTINLATSQLGQRLGRSLSEHSAHARGLVSREYSYPAGNLGFALYADETPQGQGESDFASGLSLPPGCDTRRRLVPIEREGLDAMKKAAQKHRNLTALLAHAGEGNDAGKFLGQIEELTRGLDAAAAGDVLYQLGQRYYQGGRWDLAAETLDLMSSRYPSHPLAGPALQWQIRYWGSEEAAWREERRRSSNRGPSPGPASPSPFEVRQASYIATDSSKTADRAEKAAQAGRRLAEIAPDSHAEPRVQFALAAALRKQGFDEQAERFYTEFSRNRSHDSWWGCADGEFWTRETSKRPSPKPACHARRAPNKPLLDGQLDDEAWRKATPLALSSPHHEDGDWPAEAFLAFDDEFLYLAAQCRMAPGAEYAGTDQPRPRDPSLAGQDRVEFLLDVDRDYCVTYRLTFDHRGWTGESCWGDTSWNPTWFVAADSSEETWTVEAAIPLAELSGKIPAGNEVWSLGAQRIIPDVGFQSWTRPASILGRPEGFGYLVFD